MADVSSRIDGLSPEKRALLERRLKGTSDAGAEPLAIVGMACRFPGGTDSPDAYWSLLAGGIDAVTEVPRDRWNAGDLFDPDPTAPGRIANRWGGFIDGIDRFDASFFGISPREAAHMDPQQRLLLEVAWHALEDAGQAADRLAGSRTGVFVGVHSHSNDYCWMQYGDPDTLNAFSGTGTAHNFLSGRLSYLLDLRGPSLVVDTACSSSLVAVHLACQSLRAGESTMAIVGGVNAILEPSFSIAASRMHMLSPTGRCRTFDVSADGFTRSEGCGVVVVKKLAAAVAAGDRVLAIIRGSAVNQDGRTNGITAPNGLAQQAVIRDALRSAGVRPHEIGYVEAHGTGTPLGDPIEVDALARVLGNGGTHRVTLGAAKSSIGHLEGAAGVAGLIKAAMVLARRQFPPVVHFERLNPHIALEGTPFVIPSVLTPWEETRSPRMAGVSSFGWSGTNAHVVLQEAPATAAPSESGVQIADRLVPISAKSDESLDRAVRAWRDRLHRPDAHAWNIGDLAAAAALRRAHHTHRLALVASSLADLASQLDAAAAGELPAYGVRRAIAAEAAGIVFVFPGQGSQWIGMGRELLAVEPAFGEAIDRCEHAMATLVDWSLREQLLATEETSRLTDIDVIQPVIFAIQVALAAVWRSWGVEPDAVVGHSMGEVAAAHVAGALTLEDAARIICTRSRLLRRVRGAGAMAVVELSIDDARAAIAGYEERLAIAVSNSPRSTVLSGSVPALEEVLTALEARDVFCRRVKVDVASHSPQMDPLRDDLRRELSDVRPRRASVPFYSTVTGQPGDGAELDASYWVCNLREPVLFWTVVRRLVGEGCTTFVELSPHPILLPAIDSDLRALSGDSLTLPSMRRDEPERKVMLSSLGALYAAGRDVDWSRQTPGPAPHLDLPLTPFVSERHWLGPVTVVPHGARVAAAGGGSVHPLIGTAIDLAERPGARVWQFALDARRHQYLLAHRLNGVALLPASITLEIALAACTQVLGETGPVIEDLELLKALVLSEDARPALQASAAPRNDGRFDFKLFEAGSETPRLLARAILASSPAPVSSRERAAAMHETTDSALVYAALAKQGIDIGERLRGIACVTRAGDGLAASIVLGEHTADLERYCCHPLAADSLLQLAALTLAGGESSPLLTRIGRVRWYGRARGRLAAAMTAGTSPTGAPVQHFRLTLEDGRPVLELDAVVVTATDRSEGVGSNDPRDLLYEVAWADAPIEQHPTVRPPTRQECWIVFADRSGLGDALSAQLARRGHRALVVSCGERFAETSHDRFTLPGDDPAAFAALVNEVSGRTHATCRGIVFLWPLDVTPPHEHGPQDSHVTPGAAGMEGTAAAALFLTQAVVRHDWADAPRLWFVTRGAQDTGSGAAEPWQATLVGFGRTVAEEHHELFGGLVDLDADAPLAAAVDDLTASLFDTAREPEVAWRAHRRLVPRLARLAERPPMAAGLPLRADAAYLITGGFGEVGLAVARWLVESGARRLVLASRTALPRREEWARLDGRCEAGRRVAAVRALEALGASVHVAVFDVADVPAAGAFFDSYAAGGWPPIRGVVHCAATFDASLVSHASAAALSSVLRAKAIGAVVLDRCLSTAPLDFFVVFSSIAALLPQPGQAHYAAANAFLDAFASWRRRTNRPALAINWGVWGGLGTAAASTRRGVEAYEQQGIRPFPPEDGLAALGALAALGHARAVVMPVDWTRYREARGASIPWLASALAEEGRRPEAAAAAAGISFVEVLRGSAIAERRTALERHLIEQVARVLRLPVARIDPTKPLGSLGLESLMGLELRNRLEASIGLRLGATVVWNHPTVRALATYLAQRLDLPLENTAPAAAAASPAYDSVLLAPGVGLSEEDALRELLRGPQS